MGLGAARAVGRGDVAGGERSLLSRLEVGVPVGIWGGALKRRRVRGLGWSSAFNYHALLEESGLPVTSASFDFFSPTGKGKIFMARTCQARGPD